MSHESFDKLRACFESTNVDLSHDPKVCIEFSPGIGIVGGSAY